MTFSITIVPPPSFGDVDRVADQVYKVNAAIEPLVLPEASGGKGRLGYMLTPPELPADFVLRIDRDHAALEAFDGFLRTARPRCGPITDSQRKLVFGRGIKSAAFVPLGDGARLGFLVIGSKDPKYFHPTKRTDYLAPLGNLVAAAIESGQPDGDGSP